MPRPRRPGAPEPKRRSRKGCWPCKARKVKCGEEKPSCLNCRRQNDACDYSIKLNWGGRTRRRSSVDSPNSQSSGQSGQLVLACSPSDMLSPVVSTPPFKSSDVPDYSMVQDQTAESLFWEAGFMGEVALGRTYPRGLHDIQESSVVPDQSSNLSTRTTGKSSVDLRPSSSGKDVATEWTDICSHTARSEKTSSTYLHSLHDCPYPSPAGAGSGIDAFTQFYYSPDITSRPNSFLRRSADVPGQPLQHSSPELAHSNTCSQYPSPTDADSMYACFESQSSPDRHETKGSPDDSQFFASPGDTDPITSCTEAYLTKIMNRPMVSNSNLQCHSQDPSIAADIELSGVGQGYNHTEGRSREEMKWQAYLVSVTDNYGLDSGRPDLDLNQNNDHSAIDINYALDLINMHHEFSPGSSLKGSPGDAMSRVSLDYTKYAGGYYASPVPINIPRYLSPLPPSLVRTPINLMYFHHFLNHTARMLVPHDCGSNPFVSVLPSMAIGDSNLLNLMLAYSASHRARYLEHPEPSNRIAHWVSNVFPALRMALEDPHKKVTDNHLAAAIMLLSLKIISPSTFEAPIPWQSHLKLARELFLARKVQMAYPGNRVGAFLARWLGYLDLMGTLSCRHTEPPLLDYFTLLSTCCSSEGLDEFCVDCFTGFTPRTGLFLTKLGKLVHQCDNERFDQVGMWLSGWRPSADVVLQAQALIGDLEVLRRRAHAGSKHFRETQSTSIISSDEAFYYAGLLHLHRRVLGTSPFMTPVREALDGLMEALEHIPRGDSVEVGILFPLFTAGCETREPELRYEIQERFEILEKTGMKQIQHARRLMRRCWDEGLPWIALASGEFLG
ncbi:C6 zinc finger domain protein [Aspergillus avenaceus]|uniref:C6 zinc finger domain protein n=1 Tax=Aspergillus avenaceus TaxID=36643 RepID=A0A5N6U043_ASPAV|nr:C6 zinc finger domain protein [Aspergillus avenaceus]